MATITTRAGKGSPLTNNEVDANFTNLNTDKAETDGATLTNVDINSGAIDGVTIGGASAGAGTFTNLTADGILFTTTGGTGNGLTFNTVSTSDAQLFVSTDNTSNSDVEIHLRSRGTQWRNAGFVNTDGNLRFFSGLTNVTDFVSETERARLDASGNLLVGTTSAIVQSGTTTGTRFSSAGATFHIVDDAPALFLGRTNGDGDIIDLRKDGTKVGSIGNTGTNLYISCNNGAGLNLRTSVITPADANGDRLDDSIDLGDDNFRFKDLALSGTVHNPTSGENLVVGAHDTGIRFRSAGDDILPYNPSTGADRSAAIDLGDASSQFKDLYLSGGVVFGSTGGSVTSKTLDDYEEGTFTPTFTSSSFATGITVGNAHYVKVGDLVNITASVVFTGTTGNFAVGDNYQLGGLPFSMSDTYGRNGSGWASDSTNRVGFNNLAQLTYIIGNVASVYGTLARSFGVTITITYRITAT